MSNIITSLGLRDLPPSVPALTARPGWGPISTAAVVDLLNLDRSRFAIWNWRGIGPERLPQHWLRGRPNAFTVTAVRQWLLARHDLPVPDELTIWREHLDDVFPGAPEQQLREFVRTLVENHRKDFHRAGVLFSDEGWSAYLDSISRAEWAP